MERFFAPHTGYLHLYLGPCAHPPKVAKYGGQLRNRALTTFSQPVWVYINPAIVAALTTFSQPVWCSTSSSPIHSPTRDPAQPLVRPHLAKEVHVGPYLLGAGSGPRRARFHCSSACGSSRRDQRATRARRCTHYEPTGRAATCSRPRRPLHRAGSAPPTDGRTIVQRRELLMVDAGGVRGHVDGQADRAHANVLARGGSARVRAARLAILVGGRGLVRVASIDVALGQLADGAASRRSP